MMSNSIFVAGEEKTDSTQFFADFQNTVHVGNAPAMGVRYGVPVHAKNDL